MDPATISAMLGIAVGLKNLFSKSSSSSPKKLGNMSQNQQQLFDQLLEGVMGGGPLSSLLGPFNPEQATDAFNQNVRNPAMQSFQEQVVPTIAGQFRKGNLGQSASFENALSRAGRDVQTGLDAQLASMLNQGQQQSDTQRLNAILGITNRDTFNYQKPQAGFFDSLLSGAGPAVGKGMADFFLGGNSPFNSSSGGRGQQQSVSKIFSDDIGLVGSNYKG